jgi:hypothetical protein
MNDSNIIMNRSSTSIVGGPLVHSSAPCGDRRECWRPACRAEFKGFRTVEWTTNEAIARCHRERYQLDDPLLRRELDGGTLAA